MPIPATTPTTLPPSEQKVYDLWWISKFVIMAEEPTSPVRVGVTLHKARSYTVQVEEPQAPAPETDPGIPTAPNGSPVDQPPAEPQPPVKAKAQPKQLVTKTVYEYAPAGPGSVVSFEIADAFKEAETNADVAAVMQTLLTKIHAYGVGKGLL
jgi:hypothetical protein